jgi:hypothetical protein
MRRCMRSAFCLLLIAFCVLPCAFGQSATATLSGTVEDEQGAVIPGAAITLLNSNTALQRQATTNDEGSFTLNLLPPGTYTVTVRRDGFAPIEVKNVVLNVGDQKALKIQLRAGDVTASVQVASEAPLINESPAVGTVVDRQFVANMPLNGRSFQSLITLTPGVQVVPSTLAKGQFSVNGQRPSSNLFTVDGVSANFGTAISFFPGAQTAGDLPGLTTFGTTQSLVSVDALEEFKIQTSGSTAEYGRQPGGQISIVTRSGSNEFHGSLFDYLRNDLFDANDWFGNRNGQQRPPERQNDFGGTFGGPVLLPRFGEGGHQPGYDGHNRTFFFFSYEGLRLRLPKFALTNVPTLALRQTAPAAMQPILNAFPLPNGKDLGNGMAEFTAAYSDPSSLDAASVRIDHAFNGRWALFGRYNRAPSETIARNANGNLGQLTSTKLNTRTVTLGLTASLTPRVSNDLRMNVSDNHGTASLTLDNFGGAIPVPRNVIIPSQYDSPTAQGNVQFLFPGRTVVGSLINVVREHFYIQRQFNIVDGFSVGLGPHQLRFGVDYRRVTPVNAFNEYLLVAGFNSSQDVLNSRSSTGSIQTFVGFKPVYNNFSAFAQDTWKGSRRLTLDLGLRWEVNPAPGEASGNVPLAVTKIDNLSTMQLAPRGTKLWKTTYNNFAPRLGVAYQLSQRPGNESTVRGGFGVYYDTGNEFGSVGFTQFPFTATRSSSITFPLSPAQVAPPPLPTLTAPYGALSAFDPGLKLPYTLEWNVAVQRSLGQSQAVTVSYVGAAGRRLLQQQRLTLGPAINPNFTIVFLTTNKATSDYHAMQAQFQRRLSRGLQALVSYTWSHAIDEDSAGNTARLPKRGNADFDVRHNLASAVTYHIPWSKTNRVLDVVLGHWSVDTTLHAQSALPVDLVASTLIDPATGTTINVRPNVIGGVPLYVEDSTLPGGRRINRAAFSIPLAGQSGTLGRNVLRGLPAWQVDLALRRQISLTEKLKLQFRAEAFNVLNHPNFGTIQTSLTAANFGHATNMLNRQLGGLNQFYQIGGPRSIQFALKLTF